MGEGKERQNSGTGTDLPCGHGKSDAVPSHENRYPGIPPQNSPSISSLGTEETGGERASI